MSLFSFFSGTKARDFGEGQVWSYKNRAGEGGSTVLIDKVETGPEGVKIFHISVSGVKLKNPRIAGGISSELPHFPVSEKTLNNSLVKVLGQSPPNPDYLDGYNTWKAAFDKGEAGVFTITIADIISFVEQAINKQ